MPNVAISCIAEMTALPRELHSTYVKTIPPRLIYIHSSDLCQHGQEISTVLNFSWYDFTKLIISIRNTFSDHKFFCEHCQNHEVHCK